MRTSATFRRQLIVLFLSLSCALGGAACSAKAQGVAQTIPATTVQPNPATSPAPATNGSQPYVDNAGKNAAMMNGANIDKVPSIIVTPDPVTDMQRLAQTSTGILLPIFGRNLFNGAPSTFAPADEIPSLSDYVVGPGDQILLRLWGPEAFNGQLTVDSSGSIYVPDAGAIHVAGLRVDQLQNQISSELRHTFRNFDLSVNIGHLRSIQVYVVGEARRPGAYTVSALSTLLNVLFLSGGPSVDGSMRHIEVLRHGKTVTDLDLYDLILRGDKTRDIRLEADDTIFIATIGPQAALAGSVQHPAIYELRDGTTVGDLLRLGGEFTPIGVTKEVSIDRLQDDSTRVSDTVQLDAAGLAVPMRNGDVVYVNHITAAYRKSVTLRGNLANPGHFPWHAGMRLSEIIPDRMSLLTTEYWQQRNQLGLPTPLFEPAVPEAQAAGSTSQGLRARNDRSAASETAQAAGIGNSGRSAPSTLAEEQQSVAPATLATNGQRTMITHPAPEIDWSYSVIERLDPVTLRNSLIPFSLKKLLDDHDPGQNFELQPGDIVTILSQSDVRVPQDQATKFVRLEGEIAAAGVYSVAPGETLYDVVRRAGGVSSAAYLYGASFSRESARVSQQQRLDEYLSSVSVDLQRALVFQGASGMTGVSPTANNDQRNLLTQMQGLRANGRIVLNFKPESGGLEAIPHLPLEDGDIFRVPSRPLTVSVVGAVYGQNVFIYEPSRKVGGYLQLAGKSTRYADRKRTFIVRADGSIYSRVQAPGVFRSGFDQTMLYPGDTIVVPEKPFKSPYNRALLDYTQLASQLALSAAAISVVR